MRTASAADVARELEAERFDRFGLEQAAMRIAISVILDVRSRLGVDARTMMDGLSRYPAGNWHVDREPYRPQAPLALVPE